MKTSRFFSAVLFPALLTVWFLTFSSGAYAQEQEFPRPEKLLEMYRSGGSAAITNFCSGNRAVITTEAITSVAEKGYYNTSDTLLTIADLLAQCTKDDTATVWISYYRGKEKIYNGEKADSILALVLGGFEKIKNDYGIYITARELGNAYYSLGRFADATVYFITAYTSGEKLGYTTGQDTLAYNSGILSYNNGNIELAREYLLKANTLLEKSKANVLYGNSCFYLGEIAYAGADYLKAGGYYKSAYLAYGKANYVLGQGDACISLGNVCLKDYDYKLAEEFYSNALSFYIKGESTLGEANANYNLGNLAYEQRFYSRAGDYFLKALPLYERSENTAGLGNTYCNLGNSYYGTAQYTLAEEYYTKALPYYEQTGTPIGLGNIYYNLANISFVNLEFTKAKDYYLKVIPQYGAAAYTIGLANSYYSIADIFFKLVEYGNSEKYIDTALTYYSKAQNIIGQANCFYMSGEIAEEKKNAAKAIEQYTVSLDLYSRDSSAILSKAGVLYRMAQVNLTVKDTVTAEKNLNKALAVYLEAGSAVGKANVYSLLGDIYKERGDNNKTREYYLLALQFFTEAGEPISKNIKSFLTVNSLTRKITALIVDAGNTTGGNGKKTDAQKLNSYFNSLNSYSSIYLSGAQATKQNITDTLAHLSRILRKDDVFVFYYAGNGSEWTDSSGAGEKRLSHRFEVYPRSAKDTMEYIDIVELRNALNLILSVDQLIFFNSDIENLSVLVTRHFAPDDEAVINLYGKNRIFFKAGRRNNTDGSEGLVDILTTLPGELTLADFFSKPNEILADFYTKTSEQYTAYSTVKNIEVTFERDLIEVIKEVIIKKNEGLSRATSVKLKNKEKSEKQPPKNYALLVGTNEYNDPSWPKLNNPVLDVKTVAAILKDRFGFDTTVLINPTKKEFINAILQYNKITFDSSSQFFLFIAGHGGYTDMAPGYIVFKDTKGPEEDPTQPGAIQHSQLRDWLSTSIRCMHTFVVLDVCYGGNFQSELTQFRQLSPFSNKKSDETTKKQAGDNTTATVSAESMYKAFELSDEQYINNKRGLLTRLFLTSGGKGYTVPDGYKGEHSPFARKFIEALRSKDNLSFGDIKSEVERLDPTPRGGIFDPNSDGDFLFLKKK